MNVLQNLVRHTRLLEIVGDLIRVQAEGVAFGDLAMVEKHRRLTFTSQGGRS